MIQEQSTCQLIDNRGAKTAKFIKILNKKSVGKIGDFIIVSITKVKPNLNKISKIKKGSVFFALIVGLKTTYQKKKGILVKTNHNIICLLNKQKKLLATRLNKPIFKELKKKKMFKLTSLTLAGYY